MKKRALIVFFALLLPLLVLTTVRCRFEPSGAGTAKNTNRSVIYGFDGGKIYSNATLEDDFSGCQVAVVLNKTASMDFRTYTPEDFSEVPDIVRVVDASKRTMKVVQEQLNAEKTGDWSMLQARSELGMLVNKERFRRILYLELPVKSKENVLQAIKLLEQREDIWYVGPDYIMELCALPNPPPTNLSNQMGAFNSISLPAAWDIINVSNITVGVIDTGIQADHPAFEGRLINALSRDFSNDISNQMGDPNGMGPHIFQDDFGLYGHGTHVAGIIGATGDDMIGVCWDIAMVSLRVWNHLGSGPTSNVTNATDYANSQLIPILNLSGGYRAQHHDIVLYSAIQNYPGFFVCAAHNQGSDNDEAPIFPANWTTDLHFRQFGYTFPNSQYVPYLPRLSNLISVGALDNNNYRAGLSNYGAYSVDLFAPGTDIWSAYTMVFDYETMSGTSMAAPFVTGVAALVKSIHPGLTGPELKDILLASVEQVPQLSGLCRTGGKLNAYNAVTQTPPIGSMEIIFSGIGLGNVGKFFLHPNGAWEIIEKNIYSYPLSSANPENVHLSPFSPEIATYMIQNNIDDISGNFYLWVPVLFASHAIHYRYEFYFTMTSTGAYYCNYTGITTEEDNLSPRIKHIIRVEYTSGQTVPQIPNIGSIDINTGSTSSTYSSATTPGRIGKFYLLPNNTWEIAEKSIYSYPFTFNPITNPSFMSWDPVPAGIISYMDNEGITSITGHFNWLVPTLSPLPGTYDYYSHAFSFTIDSTGVQLQHIGSDTIESLLSSDIRRVYIENTSGSIY